MEKEIQPGEESELANVAQNCLCLSIRQAARVVTQIYDEFLQPSGLRVTQFNLLVAVALARELPLTRMAEIMVMDRTTLARNLKPLEREGLLAIEPGIDRRVHLIKLTPRGYQLIGETLPRWKQAQELVKTRLGQDEWDAISAHLQTTMARLPLA